MNTTHNLKARGAAFSLPDLTQGEEGTGGTGVALCTCGWYSEILSSGRGRKAAHAEHKETATGPFADYEGLVEDVSDLPPHSHFGPEESCERCGQPLSSHWPHLEEALSEASDGPETAEEDSEPHSPGGAIAFDSEAERMGEEGVVLNTDQAETWVRVTEARDWRGNYSIAFVPFTVTLAEAWGVLTVETKNSSAMLRHTYVTGERENVRRFMEQLDMLAAQALVELRSWQKENAASRRGLTDMQKYNQHREFIADFAAKVQWVK